MTSYYRKFIKGYADLAAPLTALMAKNRPFIWSEACERAFVSLKQALMSPPVLAMPEQGCQFVLDVDSSDFAIGAVLSQRQRAGERVIAYASRRLSNRERNYCITRRELLALVFYLNYFRYYLLGAEKPTCIRTDHAALLLLKRIPEPIGQQARWLDIMEEFDIVVEHRAGRLHSNADAMSRDPCHRPRCCPKMGGFSEVSGTRGVEDATGGNRLLQV